MKEKKTLGNSQLKNIDKGTKKEGQGPEVEKITNGQENQKEQLKEVKKDQNLGDFFNANEADKGVKDFIKDMREPVEKIDQLPGFDSDLEPGEAEGEISAGEDMEGTEKPVNFDYTEEHKFTAEFMLIQLDKILAFGFGMVSGQPADKYRRRKEKMPGDDYEAQLGAALIKKYQMSMSLEWMFVSALVIGYAPKASEAITDRSKMKEEKRRIEPIK